MNGLHKFQGGERDKKGKKNGLRGLNIIGQPTC